ncbi:hypothetical protein_gp126 [Bacillus phage vB_BceM_WH1]|nr:hypothetical protein_gp126 [Bacillus phage vB_BceM_WH1]
MSIFNMFFRGRHFICNELGMEPPIITKEQVKEEIKSENNQIWTLVFTWWFPSILTTAENKARMLQITPREDLIKAYNINMKILHKYS